VPLVGRQAARRHKRVTAEATVPRRTCDAGRIRGFHRRRLIGCFPNRNKALVR
jgi:hypothetical protein